MTGSLLDRVLGGEPPPFALLYRPEISPDRVDVLVADGVAGVNRLSGMPVDTGHDLLALVPYRQITERGFACRDDAEQILVFDVAERGTQPLDTVLGRLPDEDLSLADTRFDIGDDEYAGIVRDVVTKEIGTGAGSNFVIKRAFTGTVRHWSVGKALTLFRRLLRSESGAYWTFMAYTGSRTFVGASPERHLSLDDGRAVMNPISGTYRYPADGPTLTGVVEFLRDRKETEELWMVVDEELKMMARICESGGRVRGPYLKEMARLAHTEYLLEGRSVLDVPELLRATMFAPTVTGSPIENACRVLARHEPTGRGFYSGVIALIERGAGGVRALDSAILIRTADIDEHGLMRLGTGATLVRSSDPRSEVAETKAKAAAVLTAAGIEGSAPRPAASRAGARLGRNPAVRSLLARRNDALAPFWFERAGARTRPDPGLAGREILVVDAEDTFTGMLGHELRAIGPRVRIETWPKVAAEPGIADWFDAVILGPGPGDPADQRDPRIAAMRALTERLLDRSLPFLAVCLSHQILATILGLPVVRKARPSQGMQREIELFGRARRVGFYNTFAAMCGADVVSSPDGGPVVRVSRDRVTGEVHALLGPAFASVQFHPESVLTQQGPEILADLLGRVIGSELHLTSRLS
jgi:phenazine biosynthesis protein phzE